MFRLMAVLRGKDPEKGGGGGAKGSSAMDEVISDEDLATRGGEEDLDADDTKVDRGDNVPGATEDDDETSAPAKKEESDDGEETPTAKEEENAEEEETEELAGKKKVADKKGVTKADGKEEEDAEEEEAQDTKGKKAVTGKDGKPIMIPKARYDTLRARFDALVEKLGGAEPEIKAEAAAADGKAAKAKPSQLTEIDGRLDQIDEEFDKAQADNDQKRMRDLRREERKLNQARTDLMVSSRTQQSATAAVEQIRYDRTVEALESQYPWLDPDNEKFDKSRTAELNEMIEGFEAKGYSPTKALLRSMKYFIFDEDAGEEGGGGEAKGEKDTKKPKTDVTKNLETVKKTPPSMGKTGADSDKAGAGNKGKIDAARLTDEEFDALPASTVSRMRGDEA